MFRNPFAVLALLLCPVVSAQQPSTAGVVPVQPTPPQMQASTPAQPHTLLDGTPVKLRLSQTMTSADARVGQEVPFEVTEEVKVDDAVVIPKGTTAIGTVTEASPKKSMGRGGKLNMSVSYVRLSDQEKAALRAVKESKGGGHVGAMTGAIVATSIIFFPAAPLFLFVHGKDITIPQGTEVTAFVEGDMHLDMAKFSVAPPALAGPAAVAAPTVAAQANLAIDSNPAGADIEIDGAFAGNTPSAIALPAGLHEISVKKKGFAPWTRKMNVSGTNVHINAELEPAPAQ